LAFLVKGLNICLADIYIKVGVGLKELISVIFVVGAGGLIIDLLNVWRCFVFNSVDIIKADMFIDYVVSTTN